MSDSDNLREIVLAMSKYHRSIESNVPPKGLSRNDRENSYDCTQSRLSYIPHVAMDDRLCIMPCKATLSKHLIGKDSSSFRGG